MSPSMSPSHNGFKEVWGEEEEGRRQVRAVSAAVL